MIGREGVGMDVSFEIDAMPGPQWLFGFDISEVERLHFVRLYVAQTRGGPLCEQSFSTLIDFLACCSLAGLTLKLPLDRAIAILRRPGLLAWAHRLRERDRSATVRLSTRGTLKRARHLFVELGVSSN